MKKIGYALFSFVPAILALCLEFVATFFVLGVTALFFLYAPTEQGLDYTTLSDLLSDYNFNAILSIIFSLTCVVIFGIWYYWRYEGEYLPRPSKTFHPLAILGVLLMVPGAQYISSIIMIIACSISPALLEEYTELLDTAGLSDNIPLLMIVYAVVLAPIGEELIFRGVTLRAARKALPFWLANILQALLFGIFHMNILQGLYTFAFGLLLGYVCEKGGSIYYSMCLHLLYNLWGTCISQLIDFGDNDLAYLALMVICLLIGACGFLVFRRGSRKLTAKHSAAVSIGASPAAADSDNMQTA